MSEDKGHISNNDNFNEMTNKFFSNINISYNKSKEEIWKTHFSKEKMTDSSLEKTISLKRYVYPVAATILLLISIGVVFRFYTKTIVCPVGEQLSFVLPDKSEIKLNAGSQASYHPLWWKMKRDIQFNGEAYFKVEKGSDFNVISPNGITTVLGTSFTVYDRNNTFKVTCLTGKVLVENNYDKAILTPNQHLQLTKKGDFKVHENVETQESTAWIDKQFYFTSVSIKDVFYEIGLRYGITISYSSNVQYQNLSYSGNFPQLESVENVITLVCEPFNLSFKETAPGKFNITQKQ